MQQPPKHPAVTLTGSPTSNPPQQLTREQLLGALDFEINSFQNARASSGRTRWALTLSLAGLLWLGIKFWDNSAYTIRNVVLLATALTILWDFILKVRSSADSSLLTGKIGRGGFMTLTHLLGALRSTILFIGVKYSAMLAAILWVQPPGYVLLTVYMGYCLVSVIIGFIASHKDFPPIPVMDPPPQTRKYVYAFQIVAWLARAGITGGVIYSLCNYPPAIKATDVQMAAIIAAVSYLITLLLDDQFFASHLVALRSVRQSLAFHRIAPEDAQNLVDLLLLSGGSGLSAVQRTPDAILTSAEQVRSIYHQAEVQLSSIQHLAAGASSATQQLQLVQPADYERHVKSAKDLYRRATTLHDELAKRVSNFEEQIEFVGHISISAAKEAQPLVEKLKVELAPLVTQRDKVQAALLIAEGKSS